jgi:hypothetical protein
MIGVSLSNIESAETSSDQRPGSDSATDAAEASVDEIKRRIETLERENSRLRDEYARLRRVGYRRTALGLALLGLIAVGGGAAFPDVRGVLFALGATGLFAAVLTFWITPERFVTADVGERIYTALTTTYDAAIAELGLEGQPVYVPRDSGPRLYIPQQETESEPPVEVDLTQTFVVAADSAANRGLSVIPTGAPLIEELQRVQTLPTAAEPLAMTLADAVVELFGLADRVSTDVDEAGGRAVFELEAPVYGEPTRFDHPVVSILAVGLAVGLESPVRATVAETDSLTVVCRWG